MTGKFIPDARVTQAPQMPKGRPPTRQECWEHFWFLFHDRKSKAQIAGMARDKWVYAYVYWHGRNGWRCQPDWTPGTPIIPEAVPQGTLYFAEPAKNYEILTRCLELAQERERSAA